MLPTRLIARRRHPEVNAKTILVENPYVDRHWLEGTRALPAGLVGKFGCESTFS
jgi:hypothetical protein